MIAAAVGTEHSDRRRMSKTLYVGFRGRGFWAFDVVSGVFLKHLIDVAEVRAAGRPEPWLAEAVGQWRVNSVVSDFGLFLDDDWIAEQVEVVRQLAIEACDRLSARREISAEEMTSWPLLDGKGVFPRGLPGVTTASAVRLGRAVVGLLDGSLPAAPRGTSWFFGTEEDPETLEVRDS